MAVGRSEFQGWPGLNPGRLRHLVTFERKSATRNGVGARTEWETLKTVRAALDWQSVMESRTGEQISAPGRLMVTVRWASELDDLSADDRMTFSDRFFDIVGVMKVEERNIKLLIEVLERRE